MRTILKHTSQAYGLFIVIASMAGLLFAIITPPLWGADEGQHFIRAYQISRLQINQRHVEIDGVKSSGGTTPAVFVRLNHLREVDITNAVPGETRQVDQRDAYSQTAQVNANKDREVANPYTKNIYSPLVYLAPAIGIGVGGLFSQTPLNLLFFARIATLILYVLLTTTALYILRKSYIRWIMFVVALLPMAIFQASVVSLDSLLLGLSFIFFALTYRVLRVKIEVSWRYVAATVGVACLMALVKAPYAILAAVLVLTPTVGKVGGGMEAKKRMALRWGTLAAAILVALLSFISVKGVVSAAPAGVDPAAQVHWLIGHPLQYGFVLINSINVINWVSQTVGLFGSSFVFIPGILFQILLVGLTIVTLADTKTKPFKDVKIGLMYLGVAAITSLAIISILYVTWTPTGALLVQGVQGRYFLPILVFAMFGIRTLVKLRVTVTEKGVRMGCAILSAGSLLASALWYFSILYSI